MNDQHEYRFVIDALSPDTLPMARLAEYMGELARLLGRPDQVHFERLGGGEHRARPERRNRGCARREGTTRLAPTRQPAR